MPLKRIPPAKRVDVTRLEYEDLLVIVTRHADAIKRLQDAMAIQLRRTGELQYEIDQLKPGVSLAVNEADLGPSGQSKKLKVPAQARPPAPPPARPI